MSQPTKAEFVALTEMVTTLRVSDAVNQQRIVTLLSELTLEKSSLERLRMKQEESQLELAVLKSMLGEYEKKWEESDKRRWTVYGVMLAATLTFMANLVLLLLKK